MEESSTLYEKVFYENEDKGFQLRLTINTFKDVEYFHIRKYYMSFEGEFHPTKDGVSMPNSIVPVYTLLEGVLEVLSNSEGKEALQARLNKFLESK